MQSASDRHAYPAHWEADVVLRDGGTARIRPITVDDAERLVSFYEQVSDESKYYRFFAPYPRLSAKDVHRFTHHDFVDRVGLAATVGGEFIATVRYDRIGADGMPASAPADEAEVAFLVQDAHQGRGVASALLEHIAAVARERDIRRFAAEVLPANTKMIKVFTDAGYTQQRSFEDGVVRLELDLEPTARSLAVQRAREQRAESHSVRRLLAPGSVAVFGTGRAPGGVGRSVLGNLRAAGFTGPMYAVNPAFPEDLKDIDGIPAHRSVREIAGPVDLAIVAVPAEQVPEVVRACGEHGVQGLVVLSAGYAESGPDGRERQRALVRHARAYGMRIIGPNAFGVINTSPQVRLNASLAPQMPRPGRIGVFAQSGAIGIALLSRLHRRGGGVTGTTGVSTFVSSGNRADVSGNDVLQYWYDDPDTDVALMYLESIGNPRKFTRLARRTAAAKPLVVVQGSGSAPQGHAVRATRLPHATVSALLRQAGVIRVDTITELVDAGLLLARQPLPTGPRVAILGNSESLGLLTYDACLSEGLRPQPPLDLTTEASADDFHAALARALADETCDAVVVTAIPAIGETSPSDAALAQALRSAAAAAPAKPVLVVHVELGGLAAALSAATSTAPRAGAGARARDTAPPRPGTPEGAPAVEAPAGAHLIPAYPAAERAVRALAEAVKYGQWRREAADPGRVPAYDDIDEKGAARLIDGLLSRGEGLTLGTEETCELLGHYGVHPRRATPAPTPDDAARAAGALGYPVALKATAPHLRHRADLGGVRLDLADEEQLRRAYTELTELFGRPEEIRPVVQAMAPRGVDTVVRAVIDPAAGAVLSFGLAGAASQLLGDMAHRLVPVTDRDATSLIRSIRTAPLLFGWRGAAPVDTPALEELLLRVSRLVDDHPEVVAVTLEPVVVARHGVSVLGASVRLAPPPVRDDLGPRTLPAY
ncbi:bifunctional GNAT family N-acetyltransferase/acetate--CoA ligase family protein [Streptomyces sp. DSM 15324]|uniref:bifunctional acetate--CoA ligase family protein/GNAT family N-acetyltransferase n=1 Tax=Streptomyces sp. DSM 15324 TaxID=1739111 RepID=UPI00074A6DD4|nr:bifunctional GNAT family N-acetyltransferase/acetate--CoA ligase family protein [Streptomyces sp. DSM 15324]KUO12480.1 acyl-CoA synthetase [Streptomyces sp. DSM 15324]